jgi:hypothetical protein
MTSDALSFSKNLLSFVPLADKRHFELYRNFRYAPPHTLISGLIFRFHHDDVQDNVHMTVRGLVMQQLVFDISAIWLLYLHEIWRFNVHIWKWFARFVLQVLNWSLFTLHKSYSRCRTNSLSMILRWTIYWYFFMLRNWLIHFAVQIQISKIHFNIIAPSTTRSPKWSLFCWGFLTHTLYSCLISFRRATSSVHIILLDLITPNNVRLTLWSTKFI